MSGPDNHPGAEFAGTSSSSERVRLLVISGSMGAGKTTVLGEASDLLGAAGIAHAAMDVDAVAMGHVPGAVGDELAFRHVAAVWANHATFGVSRLLLADAIDSLERRAHFTRATRAQEVQVCRLVADLQTMQRRVRQREPSENQQGFVDNVARVEAALDATGEDFRVLNDGSRSATAVARELLDRAGWLTEY
jgi:hypothetical protein